MPEDDRLPGSFDFGPVANGRARGLIDCYYALIERSEKRNYGQGRCVSDSKGAIWQMFHKRGFRYKTRGYRPSSAPEPVGRVLDILDEKETKELFSNYLYLEPRAVISGQKDNPPSVVCLYCVANVAEYTTVPVARDVRNLLNKGSKTGNGAVLAVERAFRINSILNRSDLYYRNRRTSDAPEMREEELGRVIPAIQKRLLVKPIERRQPRALSAPSP
jgi:hypothetical protein